MASFLCGLAPTLPFLILCRVIQGACGGGLQPLSQAILMESFPPAKRGQAMAFWALGIVVAPMLGPVAGGWLTDNYSWRWVFYINVPIGIVALILTQIFIFDPPYLRHRQKRGIDFWGIGLLTLGIGSLQIMLDKGQEDDWFGSHFIVTLAVLAVVGLTGLIIRELTAEHPVLDLTIFKYRSYAVGTFLMTLIGFVLYGSTVLLPLLMQVILGYTATHAGVTNLPRGLASFLIMPIVGRLTGMFDNRKLLGIGMVASAYAMWELSTVQSGRGIAEFLVAIDDSGSGPGICVCPIDDDYQRLYPQRAHGQRHQHLQPDAQHRRQHWHRNGGNGAIPQAADAHQCPGRTCSAAKPGIAADGGKHEGTLHESGIECCRGDPSGLWNAVGNGPAAGGNAGV